MGTMPILSGRSGTGWIIGSGAFSVVVATAGGVVGIGGGAGDSPLVDMSSSSSSSSNEDFF